LLYFLYVARGSAGEARSGLRFCDQHPPMTHLRTRVRGLIVQGEGVSRQLRGWADSLQNSDIAGQRHLNEQSRAEFDRRARTEEFVKKLERIRREGARAAGQEDATGSGGT
jgi:hypothetical protein